MSVITVLGEKKADELGVILPHEHLFIDLTAIVERPEGGAELSFYRPLTAENRHLVSSDPYALLDNAVINSEAIALRELLLYRSAGGGTVTDVTLSDIGRDPALLARLSRLTGVNIVMGCGHYLDGSMSAPVRAMTEEELADEMIRDITRGVNGTGIRSGVIGEIGTGEQITAAEWRNVRAAARVSLCTGCGIQVHTSLFEENGLAVVEEFLQAGVRPKKIAIDHIDVLLRRDYLLRLLDRGVMVEFDNFGKEFYISKHNAGVLKGRFAYDLERAQMIAELVRRGYGGQILLSNDICLKSMLTCYGGNGYGHILQNIVPMLRDCGVSESEAERMISANPAAFLDIDGR